jgi:cyclopropane-fatty-acyl-phospholipid synthase
MQYSCAFWRNASNLEEAQQNKLELIYKKLQLDENFNGSILEIGSGWGTLAHFISKKCPKAKIVCLNICAEQLIYCKERYNDSNICFQNRDYREFKSFMKFDRIVSVGMLEHVGHKNYHSFFGLLNDMIDPHNGIILIHTITNPSIKKYRYDPWMHKYIFPYGEIPQLSELVLNINQSDLLIHDMHNFGQDYAKTLDSWYLNLSKNWTQIQKISKKFDENFRKMFIYYLLSCQAAFKVNHLNLHQFILTHKNYRKVYDRFTVSL